MGNLWKESTHRGGLWIVGAWVDGKEVKGLYWICVDILKDTQTHKLTQGKHLNTVTTRYCTGTQVRCGSGCWGGQFVGALNLCGNREPVEQWAVGGRESSGWGSAAGLIKDIAVVQDIWLVLLWGVWSLTFLMFYGAFLQALVIKDDTNYYEIGEVQVFLFSGITRIPQVF